MPKQIFTNNAASVLSTAVNTSVTSLVLSNAAKFPSPTGGDWFYAALIGLDGSGLEISWEIVKCTARATNTLTVVRAQEGTTAASWGVGTRVELRITAEFVNALPTKTSNTGSIAGAAGTTAQRDTTPDVGFTRFNTTLNSPEVWNGTDWAPMGGGATGSPGNSVFVENDQVVTGSYTLTAGKNAMSAGPIVINNSVVVTIPTGATWSIV